MFAKSTKEKTTMRSRVIWTYTQLALIIGTVCAILTISMSAQVQTKTYSTTEDASVKTQVESGEVVTVSGNDLVVKMPDGSLRHFANVPESASVTVDGHQLGIHDLKPGMKLERTITTTTTPETITTVKSVTGRVFFVNPPNSVILTMPNGKNQQFKIPNNQKFNINGRMVDAWGLKKGMKVAATKVVEVPVTDVSQTRSVTGELPPPPPPPPADVPVLVVEEEVVAPVEAAQAQAPAPEPAELPATGSQLPLIGSLGLLSLAFSLVVRTARKNH
jgi:LPXTG-motif cell wall-anchored protein